MHSPTHNQNWRQNYPPPESPTRSGVGGAPAGGGMLYQDNNPLSNGRNLDYGKGVNFKLLDFARSIESCGTETILLH